MQQTADVDADAKTITAVYLTETILVSGSFCSFAAAADVAILAVDVAMDAETAAEMITVCGSFYFCSSVVDADSNSPCSFFRLPSVLSSAPRVVPYISMIFLSLSYLYIPVHIYL